MRIWIGVWLCGVVLGFASPAAATFIDLTPGEGSSGTINGVVFEYENFQPSGTGAWSSFVRLAAIGVEQGYNTSGRPVKFDEKTDPNFTRDLRFALLAPLTVDGGTFFGFELDINESNSPGKSKISLDGLQIYISATGGKTPDDPSMLGTLIYDLDAGENSTVLLDHRNDPGSGKADMLMLVPEIAFAGVSDSDFVYLYSRFGELASADAGFEEWRAFVIPEPGTFALLGFGLLLIANRRRLGFPRPRA